MTKQIQAIAFEIENLPGVEEPEQLAEEKEEKADE